MDLSQPSGVADRRRGSARAVLVLACAALVNPWISTAAGTENDPEVAVSADPALDAAAFRRPQQPAPG